MAGLDLAHPDEVYELALEHLEHEQRDCCDREPMPRQLAAASSVRSVEPHVIKSIRGMGKIYDWRGTSLLPPSGGRIAPLLGVEHIPVYPNKPGYDDFTGLAAVLRAQGLSLHAATDREGNVALYNAFDVLCYQARGANQFSYGVEHMHMTVSEDWSKRQLRAMAWIIQFAEHKHGVPRTRGDLATGSGVARVTRRGHVWHSEVSDAAGYHDRIDPWGKPPRRDYRDLWEYAQHCVTYFKQHGHMEGA